jgi:hypothetical protein
MRRTLSLWAAAAAASWALPVFADKPSTEDIKAAAEEFDQGKRAYVDKEWVRAAEHFEAADRRAPAEVALELAMKSRQNAGQMDRAASLAALVLDRYATNVKLTRAAEGVLSKAEKVLQRVRVRCEPACDLVVGTKLVHGGRAELRTVYLDPGEHEVRAGWSEGRSESETVKAKKGGVTELSFTAPAPQSAAALASEPDTPPPAPEPTVQPVTQDKPPPSEAGLPPAVFFVGAGLTLVAAGVTTWSGIDTMNNPGEDRVREECAGQGTGCDLYQEGLDKERRTNILIGVTAGLGVATGVVGAFFTNWSGSSDDSASVMPYVGVGSVGARGRF